MGLFAGLLFGLATPLSKIALSELNGFQLAGLLYIGAAIAYIPFVVVRSGSELYALKQTGKKFYLAGVVLFGGVLGPLFLMFGLKSANAMSVSIWLNMEMVATAILGVLLFKDHLDRFAVGGVLLTLFAGILMSLHEQAGGLLPALFILVACIFWGLDNHLSALIDGVSPQTITFIKGIFGGFTNLVIGLIFTDSSLNWAYVPVAILIGIFSYGISIVLYVSSAQDIGATRSQILFSSAPFWGIFGAWLLLKENISLITIVSFTILGAGIILMNFATHGHEHFHKRIVHIHTHSHDDGHHNHVHGENFDKSVRHSHLHEHGEMRHSHKHYPDLHHRHEHDH